MISFRRLSDTVNNEAAGRVGGLFILFGNQIIDCRVLCLVLLQHWMDGISTNSCNVACITALYRTALDPCFMQRIRSIPL